MKTGEQQGNLPSGKHSKVVVSRYIISQQKQYCSGTVSVGDITILVCLLWKLVTEIEMLSDVNAFSCVLLHVKDIFHGIL